MSQSYEFYNQRAEEAAVRAKNAELENVRSRELRAEKSWRGLAEQARKSAISREKIAAERVAKREAEAQAAQQSA